MAYAIWGIHASQENGRRKIRIKSKSLFAIRPLRLLMLLLLLSFSGYGRRIGRAKVPDYPRG